MRTGAFAIAAVAVGLVIAYVDSRPTWDDTAITAGALFVAAFGVAFLAGNRPWLWAVLVGIWLPILGVAINGNGNLGSLLALLFAVAGAYSGHAASRLSRGHRDVAQGD